MQITHNCIKKTVMSYSIHLHSQAGLDKLRYKLHLMVHACPQRSLWEGFALI